MRRLFAIIASVILCLSAAGQNVVTSFTKSLSDHCASFDYKYSMSGNVPLNGSGKVRLQNSAFTMEGDGLEIKCDGQTRWTCDVVAEECYIEDVTGQSLDYEANPALLVGAIDKAFTLKKSNSATFNGKTVTEASLKPASNSGNISSVSMFLTSDNKPAGAILTLKDGNTITITISNYSLGKPIALSEFRLDTKSLDKSFIVTDLR